MSEQKAARLNRLAQDIQHKAIQYHNNTQHNNIQHNHTQQNGINCDTQQNIFQGCVEYHYAEYRHAGNCYPDC